MILAGFLSDEEGAVLSNKKFLIILTISLIYLTFSLACDPLAFRLINLFGITISGSVMLYPALYPMLDMLTRLIGKHLTIAIIIAFHFCDFLYSYALYLVNKIAPPISFHTLASYNTVITPIPRMFWAGIIGAIAAGIIEVLIYATIQRKIKNFFFSSLIATAIVVVGHGIPTDYFAFKNIFPEQVWRLVFCNISMNIVILTVYITLASLAMKVIGKKYCVSLEKDKEMGSAEALDNIMEPSQA